ncbi:hypothetical protein OIU84_024315 [Salix udensis]|uniref:Uncharacterized protein n=1 Tax=Salix udensis TaxID=889485 RepID=A0AAD6KH24_9ROSI|nr:hypothetical protein OIU84_024315 [Salix udensis]
MRLQKRFQQRGSCLVMMQVRLEEKKHKHPMSCAGGYIISLVDIKNEIIN